MSKKDEFFHSGGFLRPQGAPRGLLAYYILHRISVKPTHGYEVLQEIENKTEGAWRPGAGSIYPILKKFVSRGYIKSETARRGIGKEQHEYRITAKGEKFLNEVRQHFAEAGQKWGSMRKIFVEFFGPEQAEKFLVDGSKIQFEMWQEILESKQDQIPKSEVEYILKEYILLLERQLEWTNKKLKQLKPRPVSPIQMTR
jgi:DNA-binding PadR family transcriptional regulator